MLLRSKRINIAVAVSIALYFIWTGLSFSVVTASYTPKITFRVQLYGGEEYKSTYEHVDESACLYENKTDLLTCMGIYTYSHVTFAWRYRSQTISYIKVNCRRQDFLFSYPQVCLCKTYESSKEASANRLVDSFKVCHLKQLNSGIFVHMSNLKDLDLSWNDIVEVEASAFRGLTSLVYLDLSSNKLNSLPSDIFCDLPRLHFVDISGNVITKLPLLSQKCESSIEKFVMTNGALVEIPADAFDNMGKLTWLDLSHNQVSKLPNRLFSIFHARMPLRVLALSHNAITALPDDLCKNAPELAELYLRDNRFSNWNQSTVSSCLKLQILDLSFNQITDFSGNLSIMPMLDQLILAGNQLVKLESVSPQIHWMLQILDLSQNGLSGVPCGLLEPARQLKKLNLAQNSLSELTVNLTELLSATSELKVANFSVNNFTVLQANAFPHLHKLQTLDFSQNILTAIHPESFVGLVGLKELIIRGNYLNSIMNNTLSRNGNLSIIDFSENELTEVDNESLPGSLMEANFGDNHLYDLPTAFRVKNFTMLVKLYLPKNKLTTLDKECLSGLTSLKVLDLSYNQLHAIGRDTFLRLGQLQVLNLEGNRLSLSFNTDVFHGAFGLKRVNLAYNRISSISGLFRSDSLWKVHLLNLTGNPLEEIQDPQVHKLDLHLDTLVLDKCNLTYIDPQAFYGLPMLKHVLLRNNLLEHFPPFYVNKSDVDFQLFGNPLVCSCDMNWIKEDFWKEYGIIIAVARYYIDLCLNPVQNKIMDIRKVDKRDFLCGTSLSCDEKCLCFSSIEGAQPDVVKCSGGLRRVPRLLSEDASRIDLSGNDFESLGNLTTFDTESIFHTQELFLNHSRVKSFKSDFFIIHPLLRILHLDFNFVRSLSVNIFGNLVLLKELYLNDNLLSVLYAETFTPLKSLVVLDLRGNSFRYIHSAITEQWRNIKPIRHIYLSRNPWYCSCKAVSFRDWLVKNYYLVPDWRQVSCSGVSVVDKTQDSFACYRPTLPKVYIDQDSKGLIIGLLLLVVFIVVTATLIYKVRKNLLAVAFVKLGWSLWRPKWDRSKQYDAFVLYNIYHQEGGAEKWVKDTLIPKLEQTRNHHKLFVPDRDVHPGDSVVDTSCQSINQSRRTIVVVSDSFAASHWCSRTFQHAYKHMLEKEEHKIIIVFYGKVKLGEQEPAIKAFVMMGDYLNANSRFFWERLLFEMPDARISENPVNENEAGVSETDIILHNAIATEGELLESSSHV